MKGKQAEIWDVWFPQAGATGISFCRSKIYPAASVLVHSAPPVLTVSVRDEDGSLLAEGKDLKQTIESPMTRLRRVGDRVVREDIWPVEEDRESIVLLPGGEAGVLNEWWHAEDHSEWRWTVTFYNHK